MKIASKNIFFTFVTNLMNKNIYLFVLLIMEKKLL